MSIMLPFQTESNEPLPQRINGYVPVTSQGGKSQFGAKAQRFPKSAKAFHGKSADRKSASKALDKMGFTITAESRLGFAVTGAPEAYEELTGGRLVTVERLMHASMGRQRYATCIDVVGARQPKSCGHGNPRSKTARVEGVLVERPMMLQAVFPSPLPPAVDRDHLRVPDDVALGLNAVAAHRRGQTGQGVVVAMVDSGQYPHTFFAAHRYDVRPPITVVPGTSPSGDPVGHGTGESANIFAVAPGASLQAIRASDDAGNLVGAIGGFLRAKQDRPAVLTNSWGGDGPYPPNGPPDQWDIAWAMEILDAIDQNIFVVFSAGNGSFTIEPQVPNVLAAGGAFLEPDLDLRASNYTSGYPSPWFRLTVPDVCGLVGMLPRAQYLMLPVPPGSEIDVDESLPTPTDPQTDETASNDGWALFSGTSAAAPQVAGAAALLLGAKPNLSPLQVTQALKATATDVRVGSCHPRFNFPAQAGHDSATGYGLVNADGALAYAMQRF